jgi:ketosteroid isomerase-like protein
MDSFDSIQAVRRAWRTFAGRDPEAIAACLHPDARWTAPAGNATAVALDVPSDMVGRDAIVKFLTVDFHRLFTEVRVEFRSLLGEGDHVTVEETMHATLPDGGRYANDYCIVFELRDGLIFRVREYTDTARGHRQIFSGAGAA